MSANKQNDLHSRPAGKRCVFVSTTGKSCNCFAIHASEYCFNHAPEKAEERAAARRKGGIARQGRVLGLPSESVAIEPVTVKTVADVLQLIERGMNDLLSLENSFARAKNLATLATVALKAIEVGSLEERLAALEARLESEAKRT